MTRGERLNNPGNIMFNREFSWIGQTGKDSDGYLQFDTAVHGMRAIGKDLLSKFSRGLDTVQKIIEVYAPPSENDTVAYMKDVAQRLNVDADEHLQITEQNILSSFIKAIVIHENGRCIYSDDDVSKATALALS